MILQRGRSTHAEAKSLPCEAPVSTLSLRPCSAAPSPPFAVMLLVLTATSVYPRCARELAESHYTWKERLYYKLRRIRYIRFIVQILRGKRKEKKICLICSSFSVLRFGVFHCFFTFCFNVVISLCASFPFFKRSG
jgi:hypothetical protein